MSTGDAAGVLAALRETGQTLGTAESLTGGLVAAALTDVPGASAVVRGGVICYVAEVKSSVLGVPEELLAAHGAVSRECAEAMAHGARRVLGCDWAVATTGVAGPGPNEGKPAGTVHVAVAGTSTTGEQTGAHAVFSMSGSRAQVRVATVQAVLELLRDTTTRLVDGTTTRRLSGGGGTVETDLDTRDRKPEEG